MRCGVLEFTPLEFETCFLWKYNRQANNIKIYSVGVWNEAFYLRLTANNVVLKFTPLEFETLFCKDTNSLLRD